MIDTVTINAEDIPLLDGLNYKVMQADPAMLDARVAVSIYVEDLPRLVKMYVAYKKIVHDSNVIQMFPPIKQHA